MRSKGRRTYKISLVKLALIFLGVIALLVIANVLLSQKAVAPYKNMNSTKMANKIVSKNTVVPDVSMKPNDVTAPSSLSVIVNKSHPLNPIDYTPVDLIFPNVQTNGSLQVRSSLASKLSEMFLAAANAGSPLTIISAYRSYNYQNTVYNNYVSQYGQAETDTFSARPGYSEHQTGLAVDLGAPSGLCTLDSCFANTDQGKWLANNSWLYGFILRYPEGKTDITGYKYEPWHFRYIGTDLASKMNKSGINVMEEYFGVSGGKVYP